MWLGLWAGRLFERGNYYFDDSLSAATIEVVEEIYYFDR